MSSLKEILIAVPTYKRKWPFILSCINLNKDLTFHLFVRREDYESGYYEDEQFRFSNIKLVPIDDVKELGLTREVILQYAIKHKYNYCLQIDDSQMGLQDIYDNRKLLAQILLESVAKMEQDLKADYIYAMNFTNKYKPNRPTYFSGDFCQTFLFNCKVCKKYDLHFKDLAKCGLEDLAFDIEATSKGLIRLTNRDVLKIGRPYMLYVEEGGCHLEYDEIEYKKLNDDKAKLLKEYVYENKSKLDINLLSCKPSVWYPGEETINFDEVYARQKLSLDCIITNKERSQYEN